MQLDMRISPEIEEKLRDKHGVSPSEVYECFLNRYGPFFLEERPEHKTNPPSWWFVSETDIGKVLKVVFVHYSDHFAIKSAFEPEDGQDDEYERLRREHFQKG